MFVWATEYTLFYIQMLKLWLIYIISDSCCVNSFRRPHCFFKLKSLSICVNLWFYRTRWQSFWKNGVFFLENKVYRTTRFSFFSGVLSSLNRCKTNFSCEYFLQTFKNSHRGANRGLVRLISLMYVSWLSLKAKVLSLKDMWLIVGCLYWKKMAPHKSKS